MTSTTHDITELLFPSEKATDLGRKKLGIWRKSVEEASLAVGTASPINLARKTTELYKIYLAKEGIKYEEEIGL
ncbi:hypothetical protein KA107_00205 [Candidatus Pacearchaeota archaeon]|nr:hypothetical protein [Candidatus Pacearchaeota archaeon]